MSYQDMVLKGAEVHEYVSIKHCHNFLYIMHLWKMAYDVIIVSIEMLKCYIDFYLNCTTTWDAKVSTRLRLNIKPKWDVWYGSYWVLRKGLRSSNSISFYKNISIFKWIGILGSRD